MSEIGYIKCPYCAEDIRAEARKCKHCGEWLDGRPGAQQQETQQWEIVELDVREAGLAGAATLVNAVLPGDRHAVLRGVLIAHVQSPVRSGTIELDEFHYQAGVSSLDDLWTGDRRHAQQILDENLKWLRSAEFELINRGVHWYSYRFRRPWYGEEGTLLHSYEEHMAEPSQQINNERGVLSETLWTLLRILIATVVIAGFVLLVNYL